MIKDIPYGEIQELRKQIETKGLKIGPGLIILRGFRDKYHVTDKETLDLANYRV